MLHEQLMFAEAIEKSPFIPYWTVSLAKLIQSTPVTVSLLMIPLNVISMCIRKNKNCAI
jgi:hypothetical protein